MAQSDCLKTVVDSSTKQPIAFAVIQTESKSFYSDSIGRFTVLANDLSNVIKISCLGYETKSFKIGQNCKERILLKPKIFNLPEVIVSSKPFKSKKIGLSRKSSISSAQLDGEIIATFIPNDDQTYKVIKKMILPFKHHKREGDIRSNFRVHVYSVGIDGSPQKELLESNVVFCPNKKKKKVELDISKYNIIIPKEGVFIGVEWIAEEKALTNREGYKFANDIGVYIDSKSVESNPTWEKRIGKNGGWRRFERPKGVLMTAIIGLEIEER
jgi:CarboxypepD_reg-like domain